MGGSLKLIWRRSNAGEGKEVIALVSLTGERYLLKTKNPQVRSAWLALQLVPGMETYPVLQEKVVWLEALLKCMNQN